MKSFGFRLDIQTNLKIVLLLDITLNLNDGSESSFNKANQKPFYINKGSDHPKQLFKKVPYSIMTRLSWNSSDIDLYNEKKGEYEQALKKDK